MRKDIHEKIEMLAQYTDDGDGRIVEDVQTIQKEIDVLLEQEEVVWKQRTKQHQLKDGIEIQSTFISVLITEGKLL